MERYSLPKIYFPYQTLVILWLMTTRWILDFSSWSQIGHTKSYCSKVLLWMEYLYEFEL